MRACASATSEPMSRPRTFAVTTTRRRPFSRLTWFGPSPKANEASCRSGTLIPPAGAGAAGTPVPDRAGAACGGGSGTGRFLSASTSPRTSSANRTTMAKRRSPSNTSPASLPPTAVPMTSCTSAMLKPRRAISRRSTLISRKGSPTASSTFTSAAPSRLRRMPAILRAPSTIGPNSSPNTFTARSSRTPAISSLKRIWMGCENPSSVPGISFASASMRAINDSFASDGSGHSAWGLRIR